ncbi:hypothetical protein P378_03015 [Desulforamulus profundi]|uniref:Lipoprotein n=1 Tax=Desulforamulus profundi TaxID=1383067 RepID=A0A2C6MJ27_9FIRM|nr:hypothetical protein [Desulforamulus profundi]PHJ39506.1 hypothetical protein P378_03015 [Desulforamulus profundi]
MKKLFIFYLVMLFFITACNFGNKEDFSFLKNSENISLEKYTLGPFGLDENKLTISNKKEEISKLVDLISKSANKGSGKIKLTSPSEIQEYYSLEFFIPAGDKAGYYHFLYLPEQNLLYYPSGDSANIYTKYELNPELSKILQDSKIEYDKKMNTGVDTIPKFITWGGANEWLDSEGGKKGVYVMKLSVKYNLYLITYGKTKYGTLLRGNLVPDEDKNYIVETRLVEPVSSVQQLSSTPFLVLKAPKDINIQVILKDDNNITKEQLENIESTYYNQEAEKLVIDSKVN